jgi:hypothetical protein
MPTTLTPPDATESQAVDLQPTRLSDLNFIENILLFLTAPFLVFAYLSVVTILKLNGRDQ